MKKDKFWKNKNVLITGVAGFVGSNLAKNLLNSGANIIGLTKNINVESLLFIENIDRKINLFSGDIANKKFVKNIFDKFDIKICFHLAAQAEVGLANNNPYSTWETNVRGTYTLLEVIRESKSKIKSIVVASSDKAYGKYPLSQLPYKENYKLNPEFPYDTSKACADMIARSYSTKLFNLPILITRFSNIYGPGQLNCTTLITDAIRSCILNKKLIMRSNGLAIRDFVYIDDIVNLYKILSKNLYQKPEKFRGQIFNAGTNSKHKVKDILKKIFLYGKKLDEYRKLEKVMKKKKTSGEIIHQFMDYKKLNYYFGWKPKNSFEKNLPHLFKWYRSYFKRK